DDGADVDDAARAAGQHVVEHALGHVEGAGQVHPQDGVPIVDGHLPDGLVHGDAGVVDQVVDPSVPGEHVLDDALAVLGDPDVALMGGDGQALRLELGRQLLGGVLAFAVAGGDVHAVPGEGGGDGGSDAPAAAG